VSSTASSLFPDLETLAVGLTSVLRSHGSVKNRVTILGRQLNVYASSFPSEIVTCRLDDGSELRLFCKYAAGHGHNAYGHRGGVAYEAAVYRHLLQPSQVSTPTFYGSHTDISTGTTWLVLEHLDQTLRVSHTPEPAASMNVAARWIGQFHSITKDYFSHAPMSVLNKYHPEYYLGWARRTSLFASHWHQRFPCLTTLCERFEELVVLLLSAQPVLIHGEYYSSNILFRNEIVYPVDWESAAIAAGEIDLASLTERWPVQIVRQCELEYQRARWPEGSPADFERTLAAARLYLHFRWLGDRPESTTAEYHLWRFEELRSASERLGII
jgi:aminoglycoside phosphotransferase (APT) family kinase protein